jgi:hypothetical protein
MLHLLENEIMRTLIWPTEAELAQLFELGLELEPMSADQFTLHIKLEIEKYTAIAKAANIQAE